MVLRQALGFAGEHAARDMGGEAAGEQPRRLLGHDFATRHLRRRAQGFREARQRALVLEPGRPRGGKRLDQEQMGKRRVGGEEVEAGPQAGRKTVAPAASSSAAAASTAPASRSTPSS